MQFPVYFHLFGLTLHPHRVMEATAYAAGFSLHLGIKAKLKSLGSAAQMERSLWLIAGALCGALLGAKLLALVENIHQLPAPDPAMPFSLEPYLGGKTIVGGLVGGWIGIEIVKKFLHLSARTGDTWVYPLCLAMAIGRIGCFLTGLSDQTYGNPTALPWAVDFGDGIPRHPTQLYDIAFLLLLALALLFCQFHQRPRFDFSTGRLFRLFMLAYCLWRFLIEFIKPTDKPYLGLSAIQVVSLLTALYCAYSLLTTRRQIVSPLGGSIARHIHQSR